MVSRALQAFAAGIVEKQSLDSGDLRRLREDVLPLGVTTREEGDMLIALERAMPQAVPAFAEYLLAEIVGFAVWTSRPTGQIDADTARWLIDSLSCGVGPTPTACRIAFEIVREAHRSDNALIAFVLRTAPRRPAWSAALPDLKSWP